MRDISCSEAEARDTRAAVLALALKHLPPAEALAWAREAAAWILGAAESAERGGDVVGEARRPAEPAIGDAGGDGLERTAAAKTRRAPPSEEIRAKSAAAARRRAPLSPETRQKLAAAARRRWGGAVWTPEDDRLLVEARAQGKSRAKIAHDLGRKEGAVQWRLAWHKRHGLEVPSRRGADRALALQLRRDGVPVAAIVRKLGRSKTTVYGWLSAAPAAAPPAEAGAAPPAAEKGERAQIDDFIAERGVILCPPAFAAPSPQGAIAGEEAARRLAAIVVPDRSRRAGERKAAWLARIAAQR